jgi:hypothetical protein
VHPQSNSLGRDEHDGAIGRASGDQLFLLRLLLPLESRAPSELASTRPSENRNETSLRIGLSVPIRLPEPKVAMERAEGDLRWTVDCQLLVMRAPSR